MPMTSWCVLIRESREFLIALPSRAAEVPTEDPHTHRVHEGLRLHAEGRGGRRSNISTNPWELDELS